mgnify:CR=1 FL=1
MLQHRAGNEKLSEDQVVELLATWFKKQHFTEVTKTLGHLHGVDLEVLRGDERIVIEAKGARGNKADRKKDFFDAVQIKVHFGMALVKAMELKEMEKGAIVAIAQPDDPQVRAAVGDIVPQLARMGIRHYWVKPDGKVIELL